MQMYSIFPQYKCIIFSPNTNLFYFLSIQIYSIFPQYKNILFSLNTNIFYFPSIQMYSIFPQYKCILFSLNTNVFYISSICIHKHVKCHEFTYTLSYSYFILIYMYSTRMTKKTNGLTQLFSILPVSSCCVYKYKYIILPNL